VTGAIDAFFAYEEDRWLAFPEALPALRQSAKCGLRLGMFSNATHDPFIQNLVDRLGFRPWLNPALSSAGTGIAQAKTRPRSPRSSQPGACLPNRSWWWVTPWMPTSWVAQRAGMRSVWLRMRDDARQEGKETDQSVAAIPIVARRGNKATLMKLLACLERL